MTRLPNQRHLFELPDDAAYFNCASRTPFLKAVTEAGERGMAERRRPWTGHYTGADQGERVRGLFAELIGAGADDIAIVNAASYGLAAAAANLPLAAGQNVVVLADQFPSNVFVWRDKAQACGAELRTVARPDSGDWTAAVQERIDTDTAIAALPPCHWADGGLLDLEAVGRRCRAAGAALVVDGTQWIGARPFDVARVRPDFVVATAHKWLMCPNGLAFLYVAPDRQDGRPLERHMYNLPGVGPTMAGRLTYDQGFAPGARRFDMGQVFNPILLPMAEAALKQLAAWTPAAISDTLAPVIAAIAERAAGHGFTAPPGDHRVDHFIGIAKAEPPPDNLLAELAARGVHASLRCGGLRLAPHLYVTEQDVDRLIGAVADLWP